MTNYIASSVDLKKVADKIRAKGGTSAQIEFPDGWCDAIEEIHTGITPTGNIDITTLSTTDVTQYATAKVNDDDIVASNIKEGINILGVVGTCHEGITPTGAKAITDTSSTDVTNYATAQVSDTNLIAGNIKKNVSILGITGTYEPNLTTLNATDNGTYTPTGFDGYSSVTVAIPEASGVSF